MTFYQELQLNQAGSKLMIQEGKILVNGEICRMRGKKLRPGDRFVCDGQAYQIITHESE